MIRSFRNHGTEDVFNGVDSKAARKVCPPDLVKVARRKLGMLDAAVTLTDLRSPPKNKLEKLEDDREGQHAIRINDQYRICFVWQDGAEAVEITDYH
jgi:proteic killer suppression protein